MKRPNLQEYKQFGLVLKEFLPSYKESLLSDLSKHEQIRHVINDIFFLRRLGIMNWIEVANTPEYHQLDDKLKEARGVKRFNELDINNFRNLLKLDQIDTYHFFDFFEYTNEADAIQNFPTSYYIAKKNIVQKIDQLFFQFFNHDSYLDYPSGQYKIKKISKRSSVRLEYDPHRLEYPSVETYSFPSVIVTIDGIRFDYSNNWDLGTLLLYGESSFIIFYSNRVTAYFDNSSKQIIGVEPRTDEPKIFFYEKEQKYVISNSVESLEQYNSYILVTTKLYAHYLKIFEEWIIKCVVPEMEKRIGLVT